MVQMSGSLDPATANATSADHVVQFFPRKPVLLGKTGSPFFARLGRQRFQRVARALFSAEAYPPSMLLPYFALPAAFREGGGRGIPEDRTRCPASISG